MLDGLISKILSTTLLQTTDIVPFLGGIIIAPLFFLSLLHPFRRKSIALFRWAILLMWVTAALGLAFSRYLEIKGIDISSMTQNASVMIVDVLRARISPASYYIGFIPGFFATFLGTAISGIGIYKRQTAQLMKELEG